MTFLSSVHNPKIMLSMLVKILSGHSITTRRRLSSEGNVTFEDLMRGASNFDVRTVTIEGLTSIRYLLSVAIGIVTVIVTIWSPGLSWSHDTLHSSLSGESVSGKPRWRRPKVSRRFSVRRPALSRRHARWGRPYFQQFFGAMPPKPASMAPSPCFLARQDPGQP